MSTAMLIERPATRPVAGKRVQTVLRVSEGERYLGDVLLDGGNRVWRRADTIPPDVVLKILVGYSRQGEACGRVVGRGDGRVYLWFVVGALPGTTGEGEEIN